jgi:hypothetical protein
LQPEPHRVTATAPPNLRRLLAGWSLSEIGRSEKGSLEIDCWGNGRSENACSENGCPENGRWENGRLENGRLENGWCTNFSLIQYSVLYIVVC